MAWYSLTSNEARDDLLAVSAEQQSMYQDSIDEYTFESEAMIADTMKGFEEEQENYKRRQGFRDPLAEFAMQDGLRAQQQGVAAKAARAAGLNSAGAFMQGQLARQAAVKGYQMEVSRRAQETQRNTVALHDLMKTGGSIKSQMQISQLQGVSSLKSQKIQSYGAMQSKAAELANQPTMFAGMLEGGIAAWAGGGFPGLGSLAGMFGGGGAADLVGGGGLPDFVAPPGQGGFMSFGDTGYL